MSDENYIEKIRKKKKSTKKQHLKNMFIFLPFCAFLLLAQVYSLIKMLPVDFITGICYGTSIASLLSLNAAIIFRMVKIIHGDRTDGDRDERLLLEYYNLYNKINNGKYF